jgi:hypothetical protein
MYGSCNESVLGQLGFLLREISSTRAKRVPRMLIYNRASFKTIGAFFFIQIRPRMQRLGNVNDVGTGFKHMYVFFNIFYN